MEEIEQLENEIKYFELLNCGLTALDFLRNNEEFNLNAVLSQTKFLKKMKLDFDKSTFFMPYLSAIASRQFISTFREKTDTIDFSKIENDKRYIELKEELFKGLDLPDSECNRILKRIANELAHGNVVKLFDFNKLSEYYSRLKHAKTTNIVAERIFKNEQIKLLIDLLSPQFNLCNKFEKLPDGKVVKRENPKIITRNLNISQMSKLVIVADFAYNGEKLNFNYNFDGDFDMFYDEEKLRNFIDEIEIKIGDEKIELDSIQKEDLAKILQHYYFSAPLNLFSLNQIFEICIERVLIDANLRKGELDGIEFCLVPFLRASNPNELQKILFSYCYNEGLNDLATSRTLYSYEINNLYSELLITVLVNLLKQLENKKLYSELAKSDFIASLSSELMNKDEADITEKDKLKIIKTIRNSFMHNRYINCANESIDLYDEKYPQKKATEYGAKKELEFKIGLDVRDLEDIKDLCIQVLIENYEKVLAQSKEVK